MLVWVASYPRSGNTLFMITLREAFGVGERGTVFEPGLGLHRMSTGASASTRLPDSLDSRPNEELLEALRERPEPFFIKTHYLHHADDPAPAIYIVRDGRDALVSYAHFVAHIRDDRYAGSPFKRRLGTLIGRRRDPYGHWSSNVRAWRGRPAPTALVRFERLIADPAAVVRGACGEIGIELREPARQPRTFARLRESDPSQFRRGEVGSWRDEMPKRLERRFWRIHGGEMDALGYPR